MTTSPDRDRRRLHDVEELAGLVTERASRSRHPIVVGVSGYCGSGKSTLVRRLQQSLPGSVRMRGDDFLDPARSHRRSGDWDGVERTRLVNEVLIPFRERRPGLFRRYDWSRRTLGEPETLPAAEIMLLDLIGLFHPEALPALDLTIWCDVPLATAQQRGMRRDVDLGRDFGRLWREVWVPNEIDFAEAFAPRQHADVVYDPGTSYQD